jgi:hypothetical protein
MLKYHKAIQDVELKFLRERTKEHEHHIRRLKRDLKNLEAENVPPLSIYRRKIRSGHNSNNSKGHVNREEPTVNQTQLLLNNPQGSNRHSAALEIKQERMNQEKYQVISD